MKIIRNINYFKNLNLDIFVPEKNTGQTFIHFHGGGIVEGDKVDCDDLMMHLANQGFIMVNVNYSLYPNAKFPEYLLEAAQSVRFIYDHINDYGGHKDKIYLSGQSAGAYIIMMLAMNDEYLKTVGLSPLDVKGYVSDSGQMSDHFNVQHFEYGNDPWLQRITKISPLFYVNKDTKISSILLIYYENDMLNRKEQNLMLYNLIKYYNPQSDIINVELKGGHVEGSCHKNENDEYPYVEIIKEWMKER